MRATRTVQLVVVCAIVAFATVTVVEAQGRIYNTAKQKLMDGHQIVGGTVSTPDPEIYCAMANAGFDFIWIEMQHSPLSYQEVARMIWACKDAPAIPFIRVPDATEGDIQKATDIGALGIIVPMVITPDEMKNAVQWAKYPPTGIRSQGGGQYRAALGQRLPGDGERQHHDHRDDRAACGCRTERLRSRGFPGSTSCSSPAATSAASRASARATPTTKRWSRRSTDETLGAGKMLGGPSAWRDRDGFLFFQGPGTTSLIQSGARASLEAAFRCRADRGGGASAVARPARSAFRVAPGPSGEGRGAGGGSCTGDRAGDG